MTIPVFILTIVTLANAALAGLVFWNEPKAIVNRLFALTALATAGWTGTNALFQATDSSTIALAVAELSSAVSLVMSASFLHFSWVFPLRPPRSRGPLYFLWMLAIILCLLSFVPGAVDRAVDISETHRIITGPGFYLVALFLCVNAIITFWSLIRHTFTLHGTLREQALYVLTGAGITAFFGTIFNILFPLFDDYRFVWLGPSFSVFFVGGTVYSIIAHHLFDIRIIIKRTVVYSLLLAGISGGYSAVEYLLTALLGSFSQGATSSLTTNILGAIIVSLCVHPARKWLERKVHRLLYAKHGSARHPRRHRRARLSSSQNSIPQ